MFFLVLHYTFLNWGERDRERHTQIHRERERENFFFKRWSGNIVGEGQLEGEGRFIFLRKRGNILEMDNFCKREN